nr:MFS-type transporter clz9-like [Hydra vulgaris]
MGFCCDQGKATKVCRKGAKRVLKLNGNSEKIHYTVNNCCNADGAEWALGGPNGTKYSISKSGWMEHSTFTEWLKEVYIPECQAVSGTYILHLDGHTSHVSLAAVLLSRENNIILICLPSHSSHILQPLDRGV